MVHPEYLSNAPTALISHLAEECAEVIKAVTKIQRFGFTSFNPLNNKNNLHHLREELDDLRAVILRVDQHLLNQGD